jgi:hypothetical protein
MPAGRVAPIYDGNRCVRMSEQCISKRHPGSSGTDNQIVSFEYFICHRTTPHLKGTDSASPQLKKRKFSNITTLDTRCPNAMAAS